MTHATATSDRAVSFEGSDWSAFEESYATVLDDLDLDATQPSESTPPATRRTQRSTARIKTAPVLRTIVLMGVLGAALAGCATTPAGSPVAAAGSAAATAPVGTTSASPTTLSVPSASPTAASPSPSPTLDLDGLSVQEFVTITHAPEAVFGTAEVTTFRNDRLDAAAVLTVRYVTSGGIELQRKIAAVGDTVVLLPGQVGSDWFISTKDGLQAEVIVDSVDWYELGSTDAYEPLSGRTADCKLEDSLLPLACTVRNENPYEISVLPLLGRTLTRSDGSFVVTDIVPAGKAVTLAADDQTRVPIDAAARRQVSDWWGDPDQSWIFIWHPAPTQPWMGDR